MTKQTEKILSPWCAQNELQNKSTYIKWVEDVISLLSNSKLPQLSLLNQFVGILKSKSNTNFLDELSQVDVQELLSLALYAEKVLTYKTEFESIVDLQWDGKRRLQDPKDYFINIQQLILWASDFITNKKWAEFTPIIKEILAFAQNHVCEAEFQYKLEDTIQKLDRIKRSMNSFRNFRLFQNKIQKVELLIQTLYELPIQTMPDKSKATLIKLLEHATIIMEHGSIESNSDNNFDEHINQLKLLVFQLEKLGLGRPDRTWIQPFVNVAIGLAVVGLIIGVVILASGLGFAPAVTIASYFSIKAGTISILMNNVILGSSAVALGVFGLYGSFGYAKGHGIAKYVDELGQCKAERLFEPDQTF